MIQAHAADRYVALALLNLECPYQEQTVLASNSYLLVGWIHRPVLSPRPDAVFFEECRTSHTEVVLEDHNVFESVYFHSLAFPADDEAAL